MKKARNKATTGGRQAELRRRTPRWGEVLKDYTRDRYQTIGWHEGDLEIRRGKDGVRGDIVVVGLQTADSPDEEETDFDADAWCDGILRFPAQAHHGSGNANGVPLLSRGHFPRKGFGNDKTHDFIKWLGVAEVARIVRSHGVDYKLVRAEHRFDKATYGPDWDSDAHGGTWDEKAQEFMKDEYLVLVAQPHSDGWGKAVTFQRFSEGLGRGETSDWADDSNSKFIPALPGFVSDEITDDTASDYRFAWENASEQ